MSKRLIIVGASGHGKVVAEIARLNGYERISFVDDDPTLTECNGYSVEGTTDSVEAMEGEVFVAIGKAATRKAIMERFADRSMPVLVHPKAVVSPDAKLGAGTVVMAGVVINPCSTIGQGCIVNTCASVDHDCVLGDFVHVAVGARICGTVTVGDATWIGAGATVINNLNMCAKSTIGAGAVVISDIVDAVTYVGVPARSMSARNVARVVVRQKVLILANSAVGLYSFRCELLERLTGEGYDVVFTVPEEADDVRVAKLIELGARYVHTQNLSRRGMNPAEDLKLAAFYTDLIRQEQPAVVLTYTIKPNVYGGLACQHVGVPYIANVTGLGTSIQNGGPLQRMTMRLYKRGLNKARTVFFQNKANCDFMVAHGVVENSRTSILCGSGVNTSEHCLTEYPDDQSPIVFLAVGRIMRDKGTGELLEAARDVKARHPEIAFRLVGSFDEDWEDVVRSAEADGVIEYVPPVDDVRPYYAACHALVHPSYHEGMSNVCLEAAAMGRPVIASNVPGCRETFDEGVSGIGFESKNAQSLTDALERFIAMPWEDRRAMGLAGRYKVVREFDRQIVVDRYLEEIATIG